MNSGVGTSKFHRKNPKERPGQIAPHHAQRGSAGSGLRRVQDQMVSSAVAYDAHGESANIWTESFEDPFRCLHDPLRQLSASHEGIVLTLPD